MSDYIRLIQVKSSFHASTGYVILGQERSDNLSLNQFILD
jgi:hypothetical protein